MSNVIPFRRPVIASLAELEVENLKVATAMAWEKWRASLQTAANLHREWQDLDLKLFAATVAEKINHG